MQSSHPSGIESTTAADPGSPSAAARLSAIRAAVLMWLRQHPTAADFADMAQSYEDEPPRRDELAGESDVAPSATREDPPQR